MLGSNCGQAQKQGRRACCFAEHDSHAALTGTIAKGPPFWRTLPYISYIVVDSFLLHPQRCDPIGSTDDPSRSRFHTRMGLPARIPEKGDATAAATTLRRPVWIAGQYSRAVRIRLICRSLDHEAAAA